MGNSLKSLEKEQIINELCDKMNKSKDEAKVLFKYFKNKKYQFKSIIGSGSFGDVISAYSDHFDCNVAIKILRTNEEAVKEFNKEVAALEMLKQKNYILKIYESHFEKKMNLYYIVTELCDLTLSDLLSCQFTDKQIYAIAFQLLSGMVEFEKVGILHCDIKLDNILFSMNKNQFMIADFGLSKNIKNKQLLQTQAQSTQLGGTISYIAPEVLEQKPPYTSKLDVYSLGIVFLELVLGRNLNMKEFTSLKTVDIEEFYKNDLVVMQNPFVVNIISQMTKIDQQKRMNFVQLLNILNNQFHPNEQEIRNMAFGEILKNQQDKTQLSGLSSYFQSKQNNLNQQSLQIKDKDIEQKQKNSQTIQQDEYSIQIIVKVLQGESYQFYISINTLIKDLKQMVFEKSQISISNQRLILNGQLAEDDKTLSSFYITSGYTIHLVPLSY